MQSRSQIIHFVSSSYVMEFMRKLALLVFWRKIKIEIIIIIIIKIQYLPKLLLATLVLNFDQVQVLLSADRLKLLDE